MFENLTGRLESVFKRMRSKGVLREKDLREGLREVRMALLGADVHYGLVREIVRRVEERAVGQEVLGSLNPAQQVIKVLRDELVEALGGEATPALDLPAGRASILLVGLQGAGKTTTAAKLARRLAAGGRRPLLVSTDVRRPAAREQLAVLAGRADVPAHEARSDDPVGICAEAWKALAATGCDTLVVDTAGRLHVDGALMEELERQREELEPDEVLLVADAMTGQDALRSAETFHASVEITGVVLTKVDGDARGGAVLSLRHATGVPVRFVGTGERLEDLEPFEPSRMVSRIVGRGDILSLIEKAEAVVDREQAQRLQKKIVGGDGLDLEDFLSQLRALRRMGPLGKVLEMLPGGEAMRPLAGQADEGRLRHVEAIILSMTPEERRKVQLLDASRKRRIARGSGRPLNEVNALIKQFGQMRKLMKKLGKGALPGGRLPGLARGTRR